MSCTYVNAEGQSITLATCMQCRYTDPADGVEKTKPVAWRYFYPNCPKVNTFCNPMNGAYVAAVTVCNQNLW